MKPLLFLASLASVLLAPLQAQQALYVQGKSDDTWLMVRDAWQNTPVIVRHGHYVSWHSYRYITRPVGDFAPIFITIHDLRARDNATGLVPGGRVNERLSFRGEFESAYRLKHVFVVVEMNTSMAGSRLFVQQVGDLGPREPQIVDVTVPITDQLAPTSTFWRGHLHVFVDGREALTSMMPWYFREQALDRMVRKNLAGVENAAPRPFIGPLPEYPPSLKSSRATGRAVIHLDIGPAGQVMEPRVASASNPAFGIAALAAVRQWRFLPKVENGTPVMTSADLPIVFSPP